jgi:beta-glucanase (GH16 family)
VRRHLSALAVAVAAGAVAAMTAATPGAAGSIPGRPVVQTSAPRCGGHRHLTVGSKHWVCTFDDEFNAATHDARALDRTKWLPQRTANSAFTTGQGSNRACYLDSPRTISVSGGVLHLVARHVAAFDCTEGKRGFTTSYIAGEVTGYHLFSQEYGRFAVRAKLPQHFVKGLQETLWLWPDNDIRYGGRDLSGEIDFAEFYSEYPKLLIPYLHYGVNSLASNKAKNVNTVTADCSTNPHTYNTYVANWQPGTITLSENGHRCLTDHYEAIGLSSPAPFNQPFFIALTQALGVQTNAFDPDTTPLPASTRIDWVRVWKAAS